MTGAPADPAAGREAGRGRGLGRLAYRLVVLGICLAALGGLIALRVIDPFVVRSTRELAFDLLQRAASRPYVDAPVRIVDIDEASLAALGQWPWPRSLVAELTERLQYAGAAVIAFDFIFAEPDRLSPSRLAADPQMRQALGLPDGEVPPDIPDNDQYFAEAMARGGVVIGFGASETSTDPPPVKAGFAYTGEDPARYVLALKGGARVLPMLAQAADGIGSLNLSEDLSLGVVRRIPLLWTDGQQLYPSLALEALRVAQGSQTYVVHADPETGGVQSVRIGQFEALTEPTAEMNLHYTEPRPERYISAAELFDNDRLAALAPEIGGKIILVGSSATGLFDIRKTALGHSAPGVEIHAQAIEQIIAGQFLQRQDWTRGLEVLALVLGSGIVIATSLYSGAQAALILGALVGGMIVAGAWQLFQRNGVLFDPSFPLVGGMAVWFIATAFRFLVTDREKREIRGAFSHYVHPSVLKQIERSHRSLRLGGENTELTVMFTDVRNFTALSERMPPEALVHFLNVLLGRLGDEIAREAGVIDKFIGDSVMAFWNAPLRQPDHAARACQAALAMRAAMRQLNASGAFGLPPEVADEAIEIGVGINTGLACVGNVGSSERFNYSAIGDAVNVAARTESACKQVGYDLVVCRSTAELAPGYAFLEAGRLPLKGKAEPMALLLLVGGPETRAAPAFAELRDRLPGLVAALREGRAAAAEQAMAECRALATELDPRLLRFLDRLPGRIADFGPAPEPAVALVGSG